MRLGLWLGVGGRGRVAGPVQLRRGGRLWVREAAASDGRLGGCAGSPVAAAVASPVLCILTVALGAVSPADPLCSYCRGAHGVCGRPCRSAWLALYHRYTSLCPLRVRLGPAMAVLGSMQGDYTVVSGDTGGKSVKVLVPTFYLVLPAVHRLPAEEEE